MKTIKTRGLLLLLMWVLTTGCLSNRYIAPVTSFRNSTTQTISTISDFYSSRNSYELQLYLSSVASDPTQELLQVDAAGQPTPLGQPVFAAPAIKARLDALSLVGVYASRLYDLTNTSAPTAFETAASALGTNLLSLDKTFQQLAGNPKTKDATANSYITPISSLIGVIGKMYLNEKRDELVKEAINKGGPQVNVILSQIKDDMDKIFSIEILTGANQQLATAVQAYNSDRARLSYDQRVARLSEIRALAGAASSATASAPSQLVSSMLAANNALLKAANSSEKDKQLTLASLNDALSAWIAQIQTVRSDIAPLLK